MTRKDYERIASVLSQHAFEARGNAADLARVKSIALDLSRDFQNDNARFDVARSLSAAGVV